MADHYLLKTEPSEYSFADLQKEGTTEWTGVTNPTALKNLREMHSGAKLVIYETGNRKRAVGLATAVSVDASNPRSPVVLVKAGAEIKNPLALGDIKSKKIFANSPLLKIGRLSVVPLTEAQYRVLAGE